MRLGHCYWYGLILIATSDYKKHDEITYPFGMQSVKFGNARVISSHILQGKWLLIHALVGRSIIESAVVVPSNLCQVFATNLKVKYLKIMYGGNRNSAEDTPANQTPKTQGFSPSNGALDGMFHWITVTATHRCNIDSLWHNDAMRRPRAGSTLV